MDFKKVQINIVLDNVFDIAKLKSAATASHIKDNAGNTQEQYLAITDAERGLWDINVKEPADRVYNYLMQSGKLKEGTYNFGVSPVANNEGVGVVSGAETAIDVSTNDNLPEGTNTYSLVGTLGGALHADSVSIDPVTGIITYGSTTGYIGSDLVNYQVTTESGMNYFATVYILVGATAVTPAYPASGSYINYTLYLNNDWDINLTRGLSNLIEKAIVSGGLFEYYKNTMQFNIAQVYQQEYITALEGAKQNINRRIHTIRRPHVTF